MSIDSQKEEIIFYEKKNLFSGTHLNFVYQIVHSLLTNYDNVSSKRRLPSLYKRMNSIC